MKKENHKTVCIIKFSPLSEILKVLPVASSIKKYTPQTKVVWITDETGIEILQGHSDIDDLIAWTRYTWIRDFPYPHKTVQVIWELASTLYSLRHERIDILLNLDEGVLGKLLNRWIPCNDRIVLDYSDNHNIKNNKRSNKGPASHCVILPDTHMHDIDKNLFILQGIGIQAKREPIKLQISEEEQTRADEFVEKNTPLPGRPIIGLYCGADYENRYWPLKNFTYLIDIITDRIGLNCLLLWFPGELHRVKSIERNLISVPFRAYPAKGKSMLALIRKCKLILTGDSAFIQMANSLNIPVLALFGPTTPKQRGPVNIHDRIIKGKSPCVPCGALYCSHPKCMDTIEVEEVFNLVERMVES